MNLLPLAKPSIPLPVLLVRLAIGGFGLFLIVHDAHGPLFSPSRIGLLAPALFFLAIWCGSNALVPVGPDDEFGPSMVGGLKGMGLFLMLGAFCAIVVQPALIYLASNGFTEMRGASFDMSIANLTIASVGVLLMLVAHQGGKLKSKLDEFV